MCMYVGVFVGVLLFFFLMWFSVLEGKNNHFSIILLLKFLHARLSNFCKRVELQTISYSDI